MVQEWVHINFMGGDDWVLPIWGAFNDGFREGKFQEKTKEMSEIALHLSTKLNMIHWIVIKINQGLKAIQEAVKSIEEKHVSSPVKRGYAFDVEHKLIYKLLLSFDSFIFEIDSCCELITTFVRLNYNHTGDNVDKKQMGRRLKRVVEEAGGSSSWFESLQSLRNFFIHEGAPYFAIDVSDPDTFELLVMRENLKLFDDESKYVKLRSEFQSILEGFYSSNIIIQQHVIDFLSS
jgi:hypothetical protein